MASLTITVNNLNVRTGPGTSYSVVSKLNKGAVVNSVEKIHVGDERWYKLDNGKYICGYYPGKGWYLKDTVQPSKPTDTTSNAGKLTAAEANSTSVGKGLDSKITEMLNQSINSKVTPGIIDPNTRHLGQPHQFLPATDYRNTATADIGRKYLENIFAEAPVVSIIPGKPNYMPDATDETKKTLASLIANRGKDDAAKSAIEDILSKSDDMRYFGFVPDYSEYIRYVNLLCRITAIYLGIGDDLAAGALQTKYKDYSWANYKYRKAHPRRTNREQDGTFNMKLWDAVSTAVGDMAAEVTTPDYINLYVDANTSFNESADNSTTQSQLESTLSDTLEGLSKEVSFWLNAGGAGMADDIKQGLAASIGSIADAKYTKAGGILDRVIGASTNILQGSNMIFPEIWSDSGYGKSYNINMTLQSPYGDKESIYLNILVPMMHILALALPRQTSANSFTTPFLVRAFRPGWFVCDMGIVTSLSIDKSEWTVDGLPTEVKISFTIKDLYDQLMIAPSYKPGDFFNNGGLMDFLAINAGLDILKPDLKKKLETITSTLISRFTDIPANIYQDLVGALKGYLMDFFRFR